MNGLALCAIILIMKNNIAAIRKAKGISQAELAERIGLHVTNLNKIEQGNQQPKSPNRYQKIADELGVELAELFVVDGEPTTSEQLDVMPKGLPFAGVAQAGVFMAVDLYNDDRNQVVAVSPDPRYRKARQYAWRVEGDSMNKAGLQPGMFVVGIDFVDFVDRYRAIENGDIVVIERLRFDGQERELTVKRYWEDLEGVHFLPDSTNPRHQPIVIPKDAEPIGEQIRILAYVANAHSVFGRAVYDLDDGQIIPL